MLTLLMNLKRNYHQNLILFYRSQRFPPKTIPRQQPRYIFNITLAFAAVREASKRTLGLRHFDSQMLGGISLAEGNIAEMKTGEGKTLVVTLQLILILQLEIKLF